MPTPDPSTSDVDVLIDAVIASDDMDMCVKIAPDHTAICGNGERSPRHLVLGPLLRGTLWETIAVPELRVQAKRVAETLLDQPSAPAVEIPVMMEYMI